MSFRNRGHHNYPNIQNCPFQPIVTSNPINDLTYLVSQTFKASYASFWQDNSITVNAGDPIQFNKQGTNTDDISISNNETITIKTSGIYQINYRFLDYVELTSTDTRIQHVVSLYINDLYNKQTAATATTGWSISEGTNQLYFCYPIDNTFQIFIEKDSTLQLKVAPPPFTFSPTLRSCDGPVPAAIINILRIG